MGSAQIDRDIRQNTVDQAFTGFESAVADYERTRSALVEARYQLYRAKAQLDYARVCLDESEAEVDLVATQFNQCDAADPEYYSLMADLDLVSDRMIRNTERFETALAQYQLASEVFETERRCNGECVDLANAMCAELSNALRDTSALEAANDPCYHIDNVLDDLSDAAYRFYRLSV